MLLFCLFLSLSLTIYPLVSSSNKPRILLLATKQSQQHILNGIEMHTYTFYKLLKKNNYDVSILIAPHSALEQKFIQEELPFHLKQSTSNHDLPANIKKICSTKNINIVIANTTTEVEATIKACKATLIKTVFTHHWSYTIKPKSLKNLDALVGVNTTCIEKIINETKDLTDLQTHITWIPALFDEHRLSYFIPHETKKDFFYDNFRIMIRPEPIICMIANFYDDQNIKNHPLLFNAIVDLVYKKKKPVQVMLAGDGPGKDDLKKLVDSLSLQNHVYFLGFTQNIPGLLFYSDMHILTSKQEACPLAHLEAGYMKKPTIGARQTGAENIIVHEKTGLLFENNNVDDVANQLEKLIDNPLYTQQLGLNAHAHIMQHFAPDAILKQYEVLFEKLYT